MHEEAKRILIKMKEELIEEVRANMKAESDELKTVSGDSFDLAGDEQNREISLLLCSRDRNKLIDIEDALEGIEDGSYGICEECDEEITEGRLKVMPFAKLCIRCKSEMEQLENGNSPNLHKQNIYRKLSRITIDEDE